MDEYTTLKRRLREAVGHRRLLLTEPFIMGSRFGLNGIIALDYDDYTFAKLNEDGTLSDDIWAFDLNHFNIAGLKIIIPMVEELRGMVVSGVPYVPEPKLSGDYLEAFNALHERFRDDDEVYTMVLEKYLGKFLEAVNRFARPSQLEHDVESLKVLSRVVEERDYAHYAAKHRDKILHFLFVLDEHIRKD